MRQYLLYFIYGDNFDFYYQAKYSILTAIAHSKKKSLQIIVYTEKPKFFSGLPVIIEPLNPETLRTWAGEKGYFHRTKLCAMKAMIEKYPAPMIFIDADTYFVRSPQTLFKRLTYGQALLFNEEGSINKVRRFNAIAKQLSNQKIVSAAFGEYQLPATARMWNSGVIGLLPKDAYLLDRALWLLDEFYNRVQVHNIEQFALAESLRSQLKIKSSKDVVAHYFHQAPKRYITTKIKQFFKQHKTKGVYYWLAHINKVKRSRSLLAWIRDKVT